MSIREARDWVELLFLILIWLDGRVMKKSALRSEKLYEDWFNERRLERAARKASAQKARETKANKAAAAMAANDLDQVRTDTPVVGESEVGRSEDLHPDGRDSGTGDSAQDPLANG